MNTTVLAWNFTNWVTIMLMAIVGYAVLGFVTAAFKARGSDA